MENRNSVEYMKGTVSKEMRLILKSAEGRKQFRAFLASGKDKGVIEVDGVRYEVCAGGCDNEET